MTELSSNMVSPAPELRQALVDAAQRGVKVKLVTSGPQAISKATNTQQPISRIAFDTSR